MHDAEPHDDTRLAAALSAMQQTPDVDRDEIALVAARAVLANAPAARATRWSLRAAAALVVMTLGAVALSRRTAPAADSVAAQPTTDALSTVLPVRDGSTRPIVFELDAQDAHSVQVVGDFNGWSRDATRMQRDANGHWHLTTLLPPGRYVYAYLIDGVRFVRDPVRDPVEDRDFGVTGSELVVGEAP